MRLLIWHVDHFASVPGQKGRSPVADDPPWEVTQGVGLLVFASAEPADIEDSAATAQRASEAIGAVAQQVKAQAITLHSFAHLFGEWTPPQGARDVLNATQVALQAAGYTCLQTPFGWFNALDIQAKGHPYARVARIV